MLFQFGQSGVAVPRRELQAPDPLNILSPDPLITCWPVDDLSTVDLFAV